MNQYEIAKLIDEKKTKINKLKRAIGSVMVSNGMEMIISANDYVKFSITGKELDEFFMKMGFNIPTVDYDRKYDITTWENWREIIANDMINRFPYMKELRDCDNFAWLFAAYCSFVYNVLSAPCYGTIDKIDDVVNKVYHYYELVPTMEKDGLALWAYEPITGRYSKRLKRGDPIIVGINNYEAFKLHFF